MNKAKIWFDKNFVRPFTAIAEGGLLGQTHLLLWVLTPFAVQGVIHPSDMLGMTYFLQGIDPPRSYPSQSLMVGELLAVIVLGLVISLQFIVTLYLYRKLQYQFSSWILSGILIGIVFNFFWWIHTGYFDPPGALAGGTSFGVAVAVEAILQRSGQEFVFGRRNPPVIRPVR